MALPPDTQQAIDPPNARAAAWCHGIRAGDPAALTEFYEFWFDRAVTIVRSRTGRDTEFAMDVVQDAMLRVARSIPAFSSDTDLARWMTRVLTSCALDRMKSERRELLRRRSAAGSAYAPSDPSDTGELESLERILSRLKPEDRATLALRFWMGRTLATIGRAFSITEDSAHAKVRGTLRSLRRAAERENKS